MFLGSSVMGGDKTLLTSTNVKREPFQDVYRGRVLKHSHSATRGRFGRRYCQVATKGQSQEHDTDNGGGEDGADGEKEPKVKSLGGWLM